MSSKIFVAWLQSVALEPDFIPNVTIQKVGDGEGFYTALVRPRDFDAQRKYPVIVDVYGGPHLQQVTNSWRGLDYMYEQLLAERGVIVWACDNRTASGKGAECFRRVG